VQIAPNDSKTNQLGSEILEIKSSFENNAHSSNLVNCTAGKKLQPRWDRSRDDGDRFEFDIFEDGKISLPKLSGTGLKSGRMKFISKKKNGNGNGNAVGQGVFVSYIPFQSFEGDITKVSTTTFRQMNFDGLIIFYEPNGCPSNGYRIQKGVVQTKLEARQSGQLSSRCGSGCWDYYSQYYTLAVGGGSCTTTASGTGPVTTICDPPCNVGSSGSYDSGLGSSSTSSSGPANDPVYIDYLAQLTINAIHRICPNTFAFRTVTDPQPNGRGTHLAGGMRTDGLRFVNSTNTQSIPVGFSYVTFFLPPTLTNQQAAQMTANAINLAFTQTQQEISIPSATPLANQSSDTVGERFWSHFDNNIANALGQPTYTIGLYSQNRYFTRSSSFMTLTNPNGQPPQISWTTYNVPIVTATATSPCP
jgi:hypothetical protein